MGLSITYKNRPVTAPLSVDRDPGGALTRRLERLVEWAKGMHDEVRLGALPPVAPGDATLYQLAATLAAVAENESGLVIHHEEPTYTAGVLFGG